MSPPKHQDNVLAFIGAVCHSKRMLRYATVNRAELSEHLRQKLDNYKTVIIVLMLALVVPLVHFRIWTVTSGILVAVAMWSYKSRYQKELDVELAPYIRD